MNTNPRSARRKTVRPCVLVVTALAWVALSATVLAEPTGPALQLAWGSTWGVQSGAMGPAATHGGVTGTIWNRINTFNVVGSLKYSDNTSASGVTVDTGTVSATAGSTINWSGSAAFANTSNTSGIYANLNFRQFVRDWNRSAVKIGGLPAGSYEVYVVPNSPGFDSGSSARVFVGTNLESDTGQTALTATSATTASWIEGENFVKAIVNLASGNDLVVIVGRTGNVRHILNTIQVVLVEGPEEGTILLLR